MIKMHTANSSMGCHQVWLGDLACKFWFCHLNRTQCYRRMWSNHMLRTWCNRCECIFLYCCLPSHCQAVLSHSWWLWQNCQVWGVGKYSGNGHSWCGSHFWMFCHSSGWSSSHSIVWELTVDDHFLIVCAHCQDSLIDCFDHNSLPQIADLLGYS